MQVFVCHDVGDAVEFCLVVLPPQLRHELADPGDQVAVGLQRGMDLDRVDIPLEAAVRIRGVAREPLGWYGIETFERLRTLDSGRGRPVFVQVRRLPKVFVDRWSGGNLARRCQGQPAHVPLTPGLRMQLDQIIRQLVDHLRLDLIG